MILDFSSQASKELHCFSMTLRQLLQIVHANCYYFISQTRTHLSFLLSVPQGKKENRGIFMSKVQR